MSAPALAKTPGEVHCYNGICHRVKTVTEMRALVGSESDALTSFYDTPERDRFNTGTITSSGEEFDADSDGHAASSLFPDGTELLVWNPKNRRAAHIRVNDFGPFYMLRTIDVTRGVAERLEFSKSGVAKLKIIVIWAPTMEEARYRRRRVYPAVEGFVGRVDPDQLLVLKQRLIATASARNGYGSTVVAGASSRYSLAALPAFASAGPGNESARLKAAVLNTPRVRLAGRGPVFTMSASSTMRGPSLSANATVQTIPVTSVLAMAAASQPAASIVARDAEVATAVASLERSPASPDRTFALSAGDTAAPGREIATARAWAPNTLLWQQLLVALGLLSVAAVSWRTRYALPGGGRVRTRERLREPVLWPAAHAVPESGAAAELNEADVRIVPAAPAAPQPPAPAPDNVIALPLLPKRPAAQSMDELRDDALAHMEAFAYAAAEVTYRQLLTAREEAFGAGDPMTASAERQLADSLREQGRYTAAEPHYRRAYSAMAQAAGEQHPAAADILDDYAVCLLKQGYAGNADVIARQALSARRATSHGSREHAVTLSILAETLRSQGQLNAAEREHRAAWLMFSAASGQDSLDSAASMTSLGVILGEQSRFAAAEELLNAGTRIIISTCGPDHPATAGSYALIGELYGQAGAVDPAAQMLSHALAIRERVLGPRHPDTIENLLQLAAIATTGGRIEQGRTLLDRALDGFPASELAALGPDSRIGRMIAALSLHHDTAPVHVLAAE
jgi:tetratricopeptide (TPR) repeat protein